MLAHATSRPAVAPPSETVAQQISGAGQVRALSHDTLKAGGAAPVMLASAGAVAPSSLGRELDSGRPASPGPRSPPTVNPPQPEASAAPNETARNRCGNLHETFNLRRPAAARDRPDTRRRGRASSSYHGRKVAFNPFNEEPAGEAK